MSPAAADVEVAAGDLAFDDLGVDEIAAAAASAVSALVDADLTTLAPRELLGLARSLEVVHRQLNASLDDLTDQIDRAGAHGHDGHFTVRSFWKAACRNSGTEASGRAKTARALGLLPLVAKSYRAGDIPIAHMRVLGRIAHNPRVVDAMADADTLFCDWALEFDLDDFTRLVKHWETLADHDGTDDRDAAHHRLRAFAMTQDLDGAWTLNGRLDRLSGAVVSEVFEHFAHAEYLTDWADATDQHGRDQVTPDRLPRTVAQRRADAFTAMVRSAGSGAPSAVPVVNIVVDQATVEAELAHRAGIGDGADPARAGDMICTTLSGAAVSPSDTIEAMLAGLVRRVVVDDRHRVIDLGHTQRFFTGGSREAAFLQSVIQHRGPARCLVPGCPVRGKRNHVDHVAPASRGGPTDLANANILCGGHNRLKEHGYAPVRGPGGRWLIRRPDGTYTDPPV